MKRIFALLFVFVCLTGLSACGTKSTPETSKSTEETKFTPSPEEVALLTAMNGVWKGKGQEEDFYFACLENKIYFFTKEQFVNHAVSYFTQAMKKEGAGAYNNSYAKKTLPSMNFPDFAEITSPQIIAAEKSISCSQGTVTLLADGPVFTEKESPIIGQYQETLLKLEKISSSLSPDNAAVEELFEEVKSLCRFPIKNKLPTPKAYAAALMELMCFSNIEWTTVSETEKEVVLSGSDNSNAYSTFVYSLRYNDNELELKHSHQNRHPGYVYNQSVEILYSGNTLFVSTEHYNCSADVLAAFIKGLPGELTSTEISQKIAERSSFQYGPFSYQSAHLPAEMGLSTISLSFE